MKNHWKLFGNILGKNIEIGFDLSRWLVGFGWFNNKSFFAFHINFGPFAIIFVWHHK